MSGVFLGNKMPVLFSKWTVLTLHTHHSVIMARGPMSFPHPSLPPSPGVNAHSLYNPMVSVAQAVLPFINTCITKCTTNNQADHIYHHCCLFTALSTTPVLACTVFAYTSCYKNTCTRAFSFQCCSLSDLGSALPY